MVSCLMGMGLLVPFISPLRVDASYGEFWTVQTYEDDRLQQLGASSTYNAGKGCTLVPGGIIHSPAVNISMEGASLLFEDAW